VGRNWAKRVEGARHRLQRERPQKNAPPPSHGQRTERASCGRQLPRRLIGLATVSAFFSASMPCAPVIKGVVLLALTAPPAATASAIPAMLSMLGTSAMMTNSVGGRQFPMGWEGPHEVLIKLVCWSLPPSPADVRPQEGVVRAQICIVARLQFLSDSPQHTASVCQPARQCA